MSVVDQNLSLIKLLEEVGVRLKYPEDCGNHNDVTYLLPYHFRVVKGEVQLLHNQTDPKYQEEHDTVEAEAMSRFEKWWGAGGCLTASRKHHSELAKLKE